MQQFAHTFQDTQVRLALHIAVFICTLLHIKVSVYAFVALRRVPFCVPFPWNDLKLLCSTRHSSSFIKKLKS